MVKHLKSILIYTVIVFTTITVLSIEIHTIDSITIYGYPKWFLKHGRSRYANFDPYFFKTVNFVIDLGVALAIGGVLSLIDRLVRKRLRVSKNTTD